MLHTDLRHFLDRDGQVPHDLPGPALSLVRHLGAIVEWITIWNLHAPALTNVPCRKRPERRPCPGRIEASAIGDGGVIAWRCPRCGDGGYIEGFQNTPWDRFDEAFDDGDDEGEADAPESDDPSRLTN